MKKRVLAMLLCLCMVVCMIPVAAGAEEATQNYVALGDSIPFGYGLGETDKSFPEQLAESKSCALTNLADAGETSTTLQAKLTEDETAKAIAAADVVTITVGGNDLVNALVTYLTNQYNEGKETEQQITEETMKTKLFAGDMTILTFAMTEISGFAASTEATTALTTFTTNLTKIVGDIQSANKDATIILTTQYNPYTYFAKELAETDVAAYAKLIADAFEKGVTTLNTAIKTVGAQMKCQIADVYTAFNAAEKNPCNASYVSAEEFTLDFHPNAYGHTLIASTVGNLWPQVEASLPFTDVAEGDWFYNAVKYAYENDIMAGDSATTFSPSVKLSRGTVAQILYNTEGKPAVTVTDEFTDVQAGDWCANAVSWVVANNIASGYGNGKFGANDNVTREQLAVFLYQYAQYKKYDVSVKGDLSKFTDNDKLSSWAKDAMTWAVGEGLLSGKGNGILDPTGTATRAEAASILMKFSENVVPDQETTPDEDTSEEGSTTDEGAAEEGSTADTDAAA